MLLNFNPKKESVSHLPLSGFFKTNYFFLILPRACLEIVQQHRTAYQRPQTKILIKHGNDYTQECNTEYCGISKE